MDDLTRDEWLAAIELLDEVMDLPASEQRDVLREATASRAVKEAVIRMLKNDADDGDVFDQGAFDLIAPVISTDDELDDTTIRALETLGSRSGRRREGVLESGDHVGRYRIVRMIGRGGMGEVYLAERDDDTYQQQVALKLVNDQRIGREEVELRFQRERQILASLRHENVARLLDGGVTEAGRPYLVMEYVPGQSITEYARTRRLTIEDRLDLFEQACRAVRYAHRRAVIHRDIKPSNLVVEDRDVSVAESKGEAESDTAPGDAVDVSQRQTGGDGASPDPEADVRGGRPLVKLLDFGIAKLLDPGDTAEPITRGGEQLMTPEYAAPEQVEGKPATTATDVYQLGILLYELLTGKRPFQKATEGKSGRARVHAAQEAVLTQDPKPLSRMMTRSASDAVRESYGEDPRRVVQNLRGDLDAIALKALRKEPDARYASVDDLLDDLDRYRTRRPVEAREGTWSYRAGKFLRRNKTGVVVASLFAFVVTAFIVSLVIQTDRLSEALAEAQAESARRDQMQGLFLSVLDDEDSQSLQSDTLTVRDLLSLSQRTAARDLQNTPDLKAWVYTELAAMHDEIGEYREAKTLADSAVTFYERILSESPDGETPVGVTRADLVRAMSRAADMRSELGQYEEADSLFQQALSYADVAEEGRSVSGRWPWKSEKRGEIDVGLNVDVLIQYTGLLRNSGQQEKHVQAAERAHELAMQYPDEVGEDARLTTMNNLALARRDQQRYAEAESLYTRVLDLRRELNEERGASYASNLNNLAVLHWLMNERPEAVQYMEESVDLSRDVFGDQHPTVADRLANLGSMYRQMDQYEDARRVLREALSLSKQTYGPDNPRTGLVHLRLGFLEWKDFSAFESAETHLRRAASIRESVWGPNHPEVAYARYHLANLMREDDRLDEAMEQYREVFPNVAVDRSVVDSLTLTEAETTAVSSIDDRYPYLANGYALLLREMGQVERACQMDLHALTAFSLVEGPNSTDAVTVRERLETCDRALLTRPVNQ